MKIGILDYEKLIKMNNLQEVTSPWMVSSKMMFDPNGVFSNDIFGMSKDDRRSTFAYIDLKRQFLHPHIYLNVMKSGLFGNIVALVSGLKRFTVTDGRIEESNNGWTGISNLYKNWDIIDWSKLKSTNTSAIKLLNSLKKEEAFMTKLIVCPPAYRDIMVAGAIDTSDRVNELNNHYTAIIRAVALLDEGGMFAERQYSTQAKIQDSLAAIITYCTERIKGKGGLIKRFLLGKSVDFGSRSVISAFSYNNETIHDNMVDLEHTAVPISQCCSTFMPFVETWLKEFFTREVINDPNKISYYDIEAKKQIVATLKDPEVQFSDKNITKLILDYIKNPDNRFKPIVAESIVKGTSRTKDVIVKSYLLLNGKRMLENNVSEKFIRPMTLTDLLYLACVDVCERRHVAVTRYPVGTDKGIFFNKVKVQSTRKHIKLIFNDKEYPYYPNVDFTVPKDKVGVQFIDTVVFSNSMLKAMGGD